MSDFQTEHLAASILPVVPPQWMSSSSERWASLSPVQALTFAFRVCSLASHSNMRSSGAIISKETVHGEATCFWIPSSRNIYESWVSHHLRSLSTTRFPGSPYLVFSNERWLSSKKFFTAISPIGWISLYHYNLNLEMFYQQGWPNLQTNQL